MTTQVESLRKNALKEKCELYRQALAAKNAPRVKDHRLQLWRQHGSVVEAYDNVLVMLDAVSTKED